MKLFAATGLWENTTKIGRLNFTPLTLFFSPRKPRKFVTLNQALALIRSRKDKILKKTHYLVCGFEPLHLANLLRAHLLEALPDFDVELLHGGYGDLRGNLESAGKSEAIAAVVVIEWSDFDSRLGLRASGGWTSLAQVEILQSVAASATMLETALEKLGRRMPVAVSGPNLPLPAIGNTIGLQSSIFELELAQLLAVFLARVARLSGLRVANCKSSEARLDARMEFMAGFPYKVPFASELARTLAGVLWQEQPKKGLITDLDDTLWDGIVGEVGPEQVSWHQDSHTQIHGLYQQMLGNLASSGVLLGICSKNERSTVDSALARKDLLVESKSFYPVEASWGPKSTAVAKILKAWNIDSNAVVFVDDSSMELAEVKQAFPAMTCLQFRGKEPEKALQLFDELRNHFGKPKQMEEDLLRQASMLSSSEFRELTASAALPDFLEDLKGVVTLDWRRDVNAGRALDLINKTNQFNLNGMRISEGEWQHCMDDASNIFAVISYQDRFGSLGRVAVVLGSREGGKLRISNWVMSCRAFSRKIEHHILEALFKQLQVGSIEFNFAETSRNQPLQEFLTSVGLTLSPGKPVEVSHAVFKSLCGLMPHEQLELN